MTLILVICKKGASEVPKSTQLQQILVRKETEKYVLKLIASKAKAGKEPLTTLVRTLTNINDDIMSKLYMACLSAGECAEIVIEDSRVCCWTGIRPTPGLKYIEQLVRSVGASLKVESGSTMLCVSIEGSPDMGKIASIICNMYLTLRSLYEAQEKLAEALARSLAFLREGVDKHRV